MNQSGYSIAAQDYIKAMMRADPSLNIRCKFVNQNVGLGMSRNRHQLFQSMSKKPEFTPAVSIYHTIPMLYRRPRGFLKHFGISLFETINPPKTWIKQMNEMDGIITATDFNENVFRQAGVKVPIHVVPHCFDPRMFNADVTPHGRYDRFTFLSMGTWKTRKNFETLIKAFYDAFEEKDQVCLLIKTDKPDKLKESVARIKRTCEWRAKDTAPIYTDEQPRCEFEEIPRIMKKADVFVSTSLGEGFGLPGLHAMALGIPVITTKFSGCLQYAKPEYSTYIIPKSYKTYSVMDGIPQFNNCIWPVLRIGDVRDAMRQAHKKYPKEQAKAAYSFVHENFTYESIGQKLINVVKI
jgi:glycosyltransferase involved in cell wall biosynthesis